ncbi:hypothetical protein U0038_03145 [Sphingobacterium spiritivorum]|nr:hypothetical protein U0038_03145 [Sphingobacterium spiritivorum]
MPAKLMTRMKMSNIRLYISAQNILTWTKYSGLDPEISTYNNVLTPGFDWSGYPQARTFTFGVNAKF